MNKKKGSPVGEKPSMAAKRLTTKREPRECPTEIPASEVTPLSKEEVEEIERWMRNGLRHEGTVVWFPIVGSIWRDGKEEHWELKGRADEDCLDLAARARVELKEDRSRKEPNNPDRCFGGIISYPKVGKKYLHVLVVGRRSGPIPKGAEVDHLPPEEGRPPDKLNVCKDYLEVVPKSVNRRRGGELLRAKRLASGELKSIYPGVTPCKNGFVVDGAGSKSTWASTAEAAVRLAQFRQIAQQVREEQDWDAIGRDFGSDMLDVDFHGPECDERFLHHLEKTGQISKCAAKELRNLKKSNQTKAKPRG